LIASLLGNKYFLDKTTSRAFAKEAHFTVLVISGLQITFIGWLAVLFIRHGQKNRFVQFLRKYLFMVIFDRVGADARTRAAVMFTILTLADCYFAKRVRSIRQCQRFDFMIWRPSDLFDQSFQLTVLCASGYSSRWRFRF